MMDRLIRIGKGLLAVVAVVALVWMVDPDAVVDAARRANWGWAALALALAPLNVVLDGWVWSVLIRPVVGRVERRTWLGATLSGFALAFFTPANAGEYAGRSFYLPRGDRWTLSVTIFVQRMVDLAVAVDVGLVAFVLALWTGALPPSTTWLAVCGAGAVVAVAWTTALLHPAATGRLLRRLAPSWDALHARTDFLGRLTRGHVTRIVAGSVLRYGIYAGQMVFLARAFAPDAPFAVLTLAVGLTFFAKHLTPSLTLLDVGVREGAAVLFFGALGLPTAAALNAGFALFVLNLALPAAAGIPFTWNLRATTPEPATAQPTGPADPPE